MGGPVLLPEVPASTVEPFLGWGCSSELGFLPAPSKLKGLEETPGCRRKRHDQAKDNGQIKSSLFPGMASWKWRRFHRDGFGVVDLPMAGLSTPSARESPQGWVWFPSSNGGVCAVRRFLWCCRRSAGQSFALDV